MKKIFRKINFLFLFLLTTRVGLWAKSVLTQMPKVEAIFTLSPQAQERSYLTGQELFKYALNFNFVQPGSKEEEAYLKEFNRYLETLQNRKLNYYDSKKRRAEFILEFMHERILTQYDENQSFVEVAFDQGTYNCVSSAIIYAALCKCSGIEVYANEIPEHLYCTVVINGKEYDVETTTPYGFNSRYRKKDNPEDYKNPEKLSDFKFVSCVATNAVYDDKEVTQYEKIIPLAYTRYLLMQGDRSASNDGQSYFENACISFIYELQQGKNYDQVLKWMDFVYEKISFSEKLLEVYEKAVSNCVIIRVNSGEYDGAQEVLDAHKNFISQSLFDEKQKYIDKFRNKSESKDSAGEKSASANSEAGAGNSSTSVSAGKNRKTNNLLKIDQALDGLSYGQGVLEAEKFMKDPLYSSDSDFRKRVNEWFSYFATNLCVSYGLAGDDLKAAYAADNYLKILPGDKDLEKISYTAWYNYDVDVHNKYCEFIKAGNLKGAKNVLEEGLKIHPDSKSLKADLEDVKKYL